MIWVLLEIVLPLCFAFLLGIGLGWLFWRWRRGTVSQTHALSKAGDSSNPDTLQQATSGKQKRIDQLEITLQEHLQKLSEAENHSQSLSVELKSVKQKLATSGSEKSSPNQALNTASEDNTKLEQALIREKKQISKIEELEFRSNNLRNTVDKQEKQLQLFSRDIKRLSAELRISKEQLATKTSDVNAEDLQQLQSALALLKQEKTQTEQKIQDVTTDANYQKNTVKELTQNASNLENIIERQADELLQAKRNAQKLNDEIESNQSKVEDSDKLNEKLLALQSQFESTKAGKESAEQQLDELSGEVSKKADTIAELQKAIDTLEATAQTQSVVLQQSETKLKTMSEELKADIGKHEEHRLASAEEIQKLQRTLQETSNLKDQLDKELQEVTSRTGEQSNLSNELRQKLKQSENVVTERDTAIAKIKQLEDELTGAYLKSSDLDQTKAQLEEVTQKFRNFQTSTLASRQEREEQLDKQRTQIETLKNALENERVKLSGYNKNAQQLQQLEQELKQHPDLQKQLEQAKQEIKELADVKTKLAETTAQLANARIRNSQLVAKIENTPTPAAVTPISVAQVNKLKKVVATQEKQIEELEKQLQHGSANKKATPVNKTPAWQKGLTSLGTPGCDHRDDLKVINGIGPKIEKVLNQLGIQSWQQLATLKVAEINKIDDTLVDFRGRIQRDEWVTQAKAILRNNQQATNQQKEKGSKKTAKATTKKPSPKSKTKFGTPAATHQDDLKVISGIGPVIETALNNHGIKSWEQLASLKSSEIKAIDETLGFPGRINREQWAAQAKTLVRQFPEHSERATQNTTLKKAAGQ